VKQIIERLLIFIIGGLLGYYLKPTPYQKIPTTDIISKDSIIRDSIYIVNDSISIKIKYLDKKYDEQTSNIMSSSDSININFFTEYINNYKRTIETD
jgi:hypothetical protein